MTDRPRRTASGTGDLDHALDRVCRTRGVPGNAAVHLHDGPATFQTTIDGIRAASSWVQLENYIIRDDETGCRIAMALTDAASRGVAVAVIYDHVGSLGTSRRFWHSLRDAGVAVRAFNRLSPIAPHRWIRRNHRKYVGIDGARAVVGGICYGREWAGDPDKGIPPWRDTSAEIRGPAVPAMALTFQHAWEIAGGTPLPYVIPTNIEQAGDASIRVVEGIPWRMRLYRAVEILAAGARNRIWITDAYLVSATPLFRTVIAAARDGVDVRLLLPGKSDLPAVRTLTRVGYRELLEAGVRIWEWHGPMLHAKTAIIDDRWYKVGSSNLNPSSLMGNYELDLLIDNIAVTSDAAQTFRRDLTNGVEIILRHRLRGVTRTLPPVVTPVARPRRSQSPTWSVGEAGRRTVATVRQVAGGARRSILGAVVFVLIGWGVLLLALPRITAYVLAAISFWLAGAAGWHFVRLRRIGRH